MSFVKKKKKEKVLKRKQTKSVYLLDLADYRWSSKCNDDKRVSKHLIKFLSDKRSERKFILPRKWNYKNLKIKSQIKVVMIFHQSLNRVRDLVYH